MEQPILASYSNIIPGGMISVACAIIQDEIGRYLLAKRPPGKCLAGCWEFPGGKVEPGETVAAALIRELEEELQIKTEVFQLLDFVDYHYAKFSIRLIPCRAKIASGAPIPTEHSEIGWFLAEDINPETLAPADVPILSMLGKR